MEVKKTLKRIAIVGFIGGVASLYVYSSYLNVKKKQEELILAEYNGINEGKRVGAYGASPAILYAADLDGDEKKDYVVISNDSEYQTIFLQQEDGTYKRLDEVNVEAQAKALSQIEEKIKSIEEKVSGIEKKVEETK